MERIEMGNQRNKQKLTPPLPPHPRKLLYFIGLLREACLYPRALFVLCVLVPMLFSRIFPSFAQCPFEILPSC